MTEALAVIDRRTGEVINLDDPPSLVLDVHGRCSAIETWAASCDSLSLLRDANNKLAAIDEYLGRTSKEGRARVAATMRRLEVRIGELLGPAPDPRETGARKGSGATEPLNHHDRHDFRQMAAHPDVVEEVIAGSTDEKPASRRGVVGAIRGTRGGVPMPRGMRRSPSLAVDQLLRHVADEIATTIRVAAEQPWEEADEETRAAVLAVLVPSRTKLHQIITRADRGHK